MLQQHLSHDLPDYVVTKRNAKVYKEGRWWTWEHQCLHRPKTCPANGYPHESQQRALYYALEHWRRCL